ncbi:MAG TPA: GlsB/YeaQ/YmgE family stress response membrane protein [Blastocatellia bacterium]|nr:GlsB/YeaQ/YmgE family stress response membrane protein [Blastocatellia bacterium]
MNMSLEGLIILLIVAGVAGAIGQWLAGYSRGGLITSIALGFVGAFLGIWVAQQFRLPVVYAVQIGRTSFPIVWAILGAALFVAILGLLRRRRYV